MNALCRRLLRRRRIEEELDEEVQGYFEILIERHMAQGLSRAEATLGASRGAILGMFLRETMRLGAVGLAALGPTRFLQGLLYGVRANEPRILTSAIAFLAFVTSIACLAPALHAMRVDPITALRDE